MSLYESIHAAEYPSIISKHAEESQWLHNPEKTRLRPPVEPLFDSSILGCCRNMVVQHTAFSGGEPTPSVNIKGLLKGNLPPAPKTLIFRCIYTYNKIL